MTIEFKEPIKLPPQPIDLDRGLTAKGSYLHPEVGVIYMAKDEPGVYYSAKGKPVSETVARLVGFDVDLHARARMLKSQRAALDREMEEQLKLAASKAPVVLVERGGFKLVEKPFGRADVTDADGDLINVRPLTLEEATLLFDKIAPAETANV